jgi:outer membrane protein assembly factor BamA
MDSSMANLSLRFREDSIPVPPPDTLVVFDEGGRELPQLSSFLQGSGITRGRYLHSGERPGWQVWSRSYFRTENGYGIRYDVRDVSNQTVQILAGYDRQDSRAGELVGEIALDLPNFLGTLRYLQIHWRRLSAVTQTIRLAYTEPSLPFLPVGSHLAFRQALRDTLYLERDFKVQLTSLPGQQWITAIGVGTRILHVTGHGNAQGLKSYRQQSINLSLQRQTFDRSANPVRPVRGWQFRLFLEGGTLSGTHIDSKAALAQLELRLGAVWTPSRITLAQEIRTVRILGVNYSPQVSEYGQFGGGASLRGYQEDQFLSPWGIVSRSELRMPAGTTSRWHLFMDNGWLAEVPWLASVGFGFVLHAGREQIQLDLAWNKEDSFRGAKIHLRLIGLLAGE